MLPYSSEMIDREIADYERLELDSIRPTQIDFHDLVRGHQFVRVQTICNFWESGNQANFLQHVVDFVITAHAYKGYLTFLFTGTSHGIGIYFALKDQNTVTSLLEANFPGIQIGNNLVSGLETHLAPCLAYTGMLSGIPSRKDHPESGASKIDQDFYHLERVVRGMQDTSWMYIVQAYARPLRGLVDERQSLLDKIANVASMTRGQVQRSFQETQPGANRATISSSEMMGGEIVNRRAEYAVKLFERQLERIDASLSMGRWQTAVYFGASTQDHANRLASLLLGVLTGPDSRPDPLRVHFCQNEGNKSEQFHTYLTSEELALLIKLPREEAPGYAVGDLSVFDVDFKPLQSPGLDLGQILWNNREIGQRYKLTKNDLTRHGVVIGVTGSGKTTTLLHMLNLLNHSRPPVPFLVIEPAKTEYRTLLNSIDNGKATGPIPNLRVYTLGSDNVSPFRLNPFEFDLGEEPDNSPLLSHIDFLKAVFNAAFILYAPMPYVLETALHEVYEDKGWNLATETNVRLNDKDWSQRNRYPIFPTLTDLYFKVEEVIARLGYEAKLQQDVTAGLKARIGALRIGAKGLMLDTPRGIPFQMLLNNPVVLEMENIGNDDEKTFLMGLILARLYGYRRLQAGEGKLRHGLQHILVIEEAHRLLKNVNTQVDVEASNPRAQAIETFVNMLSEVRYYGQGVLVAEQIPSKLTPDVIKNTNLKLVHRLLAQDDRHALGESMNMNEMQMKRLATLAPGQAVVFAEGDDHPLLMKIENFKETHHLKTPLSATLLPIVESYTSLAPYLLTPDFSNFGLRVSRFGGPDPIVYQTAMKHLNRWDNERVWARIILRTVFARERLPDVLNTLRHRLSSEPGQLSIGQLSEGLLMLIILGVADAIEGRSVDNNWPFATADAFRLSLTNGLAKLVRLNDLKTSAPELDRFVRAYEAGLMREYGPFPGCRSCKAICLYRTEARRLLTPNDLNNIREILLSSTNKSEEDRYITLRKTMRLCVLQWLGGSAPEVNEIAYCALLIAASVIGFDEYTQARTANRLISVMPI
jgi:DNA helicase HerA-like ATPase